MRLSIYPKPASMVEVEGSGTLDIDDGKFSGTRIAECDMQDTAAAISYLLGDIVLTPSGTQQRWGGDEWPGIPYLRATKVGVKGVGQFCSTVRDWEQGPTYPKARLTIGYSVDEARDEDDENENDPEDQTNLIQSLDYGCEILSVPMVVGSSGTPLAERKSVIRHIRLPTIIYTATIPKVRAPDWEFIRENVGKVNSDVIFGGDPGTVLFDGPHAEKERKIFSKSFWKLSYKLIYNRYGWNKQLNPDTLDWEDAWDKDAGAQPPYESAALRTLIQV